jgi:hypothetical protein
VHQPLELGQPARVGVPVFPGQQAARQRRPQGVTVLSTSLNDSCPADDARAAARILIDASLP